MERLGLARFFAAGSGAFGCESESRSELIALARARAGWLAAGGDGRGRRHRVRPEQRARGGRPLAARRRRHEPRRQPSRRSASRRAGLDSGHGAGTGAFPRDSSFRSSRGCPRIGSIDQVALEERAATLAKRSIKKDAKVFALDLAVRMTDLTTLEGSDTPGKVAASPRRPCAPTLGHERALVAALCVYPNMVPTAVERLRDSSVKVASVATAFPSGQSPLETSSRRCAGWSSTAPTRSTW
jgi:hypothetical protein